MRRYQAKRPTAKVQSSAEYFREEMNFAGALAQTHTAVVRRLRQFQALSLSCEATHATRILPPSIMPIGVYRTWCKTSVCFPSSWRLPWGVGDTRHKRCLVMTFWCLAKVAVAPSAFAAFSKQGARAATQPRKVRHARGVPRRPSGMGIVCYMRPDWEVQRL